jgi:hypothetical protein
MAKKKQSEDDGQYKVGDGITAKLNENLAFVSQRGLLAEINRPTGYRIG